MTPATTAKPWRRRGGEALRSLDRLVARARVTAHAYAVPAIATVLIQGVVL